MAMIPLRYAFQPVAKCRRMSSPPSLNGGLGAWSRDYLLADWISDETDPPFATVYTAWDDASLYFAFQANLRRPPRALPRRFWSGDCVEVFLDLRGTLNHNECTEHCHHFFLLPQGGGNKTTHAGRCEAGVERQIAIAQDDTVIVASEAFPQGYRMEVAFPRAAIPTYDPASFPHIGFNYLIREGGGRTQFWSVGPELQTFRDPSTWGSLDLTD